MRSRPLSMVAVGLVLVGLDFRLVQVDLLPDPIGWLLVALAAWRLRFSAPMVLAAVASLASLSDVVLTYHWEDLDPLTGEVVVNGGGTAYDQRLAYDLVTDIRAPLMILALACGALALVIMAVRLEPRARLLGDERAVRELSLVPWLVGAVWAGPQVLVMSVQWLAGDGLDPVWGGALELLALAGLLAVALLVVGSAVNRNRGWTATDEERPSPWPTPGRRRTSVTA